MALNLNPCKEVLIASGKIYLKKGNKDQAIQRFEDALKLSPDDNNLMSTLGSLYLKAKDYEKAIDYFNKVLEVDKKYSKSLLGLAAINQLNGKFEEAYELLSMGYSSNNNSAYLWNNLGMWFFAKEKKIFAATCLKRALYLAPFEWFISFNLGLVYLKNEQYVTAFVHMNTAANLSKNQPNVYLYLAIICSELNNDGNAKNCFERALSLKEDPIILFNYIIFLLKKKMFKEAKEKFDKLKDINSKLKKKNEEIDAQIPVINKILGTG
jgi:Bardet-Biedl syndrome 4 protein